MFIKAQRTNSKEKQQKNDGCFVCWEKVIYYIKINSYYKKLE